MREPREQEGPEDSVLNRPVWPIVFYVPNVLRQVIKNGGQVVGMEPGEKRLFAPA